MTIFNYTFMQNALFVSFFIAILCPCIGIFLVLRRQSMIGDTLSHASLAGVTIALLFGFNPILGAFIFTALSGVLIESLRNYFKKYRDLILTIVLALGVGVAITIISSGQLKRNADAFMFGSILTVNTTDMLLVFILSMISVLSLIFLYHQLLYSAFDEDTAIIVGVKVKMLNYIFSLLVAATIAVSIRIVGVLVLSSMIALPVATALQFKKGFKITLLLSIFFSLFDILIGLVAAYYLNVAPGGFTALVSVFTLMVVILALKIKQRKRAY